MTKISEAITSLKNGNFVLIHDDGGREDEVDMVVSSNNISPEHIATMRKDAGGLICTAISKEIATKLGLPFIYDVLNIFGTTNQTISSINSNSSPYGDRPSFSVTLNHINTYTGITDRDRALTISSLANICNDLSDYQKDQKTTIEQFLISHKVERIKELIIYGELNITEIAWKMNYSSVAHLSNQFKKVTGLSPSHFKQLKDKRRSPLEDIGNPFPNQNQA